MNWNHQKIQKDCRLVRQADTPRAELLLAKFQPLLARIFAEHGRLPGAVASPSKCTGSQHRLLSKIRAASAAHAHHPYWAMVGAPLRPANSHNKHWNSIHKKGSNIRRDFNNKSEDWTKKRGASTKKTQQISDAYTYFRNDNGRLTNRHQRWSSQICRNMAELRRNTRVGSGAQKHKHGDQKHGKNAIFTGLTWEK